MSLQKSPWVVRMMFLKHIIYILLSITSLWLFQMYNFPTSFQKPLTKLLFKTWAFSSKLVLESLRLWLWVFPNAQIGLLHPRALFTGCSPCLVYFHLMTLKICSQLKYFDFGNFFSQICQIGSSPKQLIYIPFTFICVNILISC